VYSTEEASFWDISNALTIIGIPPDGSTGSYVFGSNDDGSVFGVSSNISGRLTNVALYKWTIADEFVPLGISDQHATMAGDGTIMTANYWVVTDNTLISTGLAAGRMIAKDARAGVGYLTESGGSETLAYVFFPPSAAPSPVLSCGPHGLTFITPTWTYDGDVDTYTIQYRKVGDTDWIEVTGIVGNAYEIDGLPLGTCYELQVAAVFESVQGDFSDIETCCTYTQVSMADLWFGSTVAFVDLTTISNRRKFISGDGGAQNLGGSGSRPFGSAPTVFLTNSGVPDTFATNNGTGGSFAISFDELHDGPSNPPGTTTTTVTTQDNTLNHGVLGDYRNGRLYAFNKATLTDNGTPRKWLRRWRALPQATDKAIKFNWLNIGVQTGQGVPPGTNPQLVLRWSDDGGNVWSHGRFLPVGKTGATTAVIKFNRLGMTRRYGGSDRIFELSSTDPFEVAIMDAETEAV
jgi:hypothetical protein